MQIQIRSTLMFFMLLGFARAENGRKPDSLWLTMCGKITSIVVYPIGENIINAAELSANKKGSLLEDIEYVFQPDGAASVTFKDKTLMSTDAASVLMLSYFHKSAVCLGRDSTGKVLKITTK